MREKRLTRFGILIIITLLLVEAGITVKASAWAYKEAAYEAVMYLKDAWNNNTNLLDAFEESVHTFTDSVEATTKQDLAFASEFDDLYAIIQRALNKQKYNYTTVAKNRYMIVTTPEMSDDDIWKDVNGVLTLTEVAESVGADVYAVQTPMRYTPGETVLPPSVEDYSQENADRYIEELKNNGFSDILDLREDSYYNKEENYYSTDHHWRLEVALRAAQDITKALNQRFSYNLNEETVNPDNYEYDVWKYKMKGSWARRTNPYFIDAEDFVIVKPAFETNLELRQYDIWGNYVDNRTGTFDKTIIFDEGLPTETYDKNAPDLGYYAYLNATYTSWIKNNNADNDKKLLILGDSSCRGLGSFISMAFAQTLIIDTDPERYQISLDKTITEYQPDLVLFVSTVELDHTERFDIKRGADVEEGTTAIDSALEE